MSAEAYPVVFIPSEGVLGQVINYGAYASRVVYFVNGYQFDSMLENDELVPVEELLSEYENE